MNWRWSLAKRATDRPVRVIEEGSEAELAAWREAARVVICVPPDPRADRARVAAWRARPGSGGRIVHLGAGAEGSAPWKDLPEFVSLGTLFEMLQSHSECAAGSSNARAAPASRRPCCGT